MTARTICIVLVLNGALLAALACTKEQLNRIDPPASIAGDVGWTPDNTQPEDVPNCGTLGCSGGLGSKRDSGAETGAN